MQLANLIKLASYTGARIEELCSIGVADVDLAQRSIKITVSKTSAGIRTIPIHTALIDLVTGLATTSTDSYLISGLTFNKYGDRSNAIGKRFGRLKLALKFGRQHVFHSIRKTVTTQLENAGVPENVAADILGHDKPTMTYGLYSGGSSLTTMHAAIAKLRYDFHHSNSPQ